jgi:predicted alpha/beta-fold hydrolase
VVPRFGYRSVDDYYERESASPRLHRLRIPALVIATRHDPIIPAETLVPTLENASPSFSIAWIERGGHIYGPHRLEDHAMQWLSKQ